MCPARSPATRTSTISSTNSTRAASPGRNGPSRQPNRATCSTTAAWAGNPFVSHHSPALYFDDIQAQHTSEDVNPSPECRQKVLPAGGNAPKDMSIFDTALQAGTVARFDMVNPNNCENGHDPCGTNDPVHQFDDFVAREVPKIQAPPHTKPTD